MGVRPDGAGLVGDDLSNLIDYEGHLRMIPAVEGLDDLLSASGLTKLTEAQWLHAPRPCDPAKLINEYEARLEAAGSSGGIGNPRLLDPSTPVNYYRGRWRPPRSTDDGTFVARRPQAYGADLWCFARVTAGEITQLVDLPLLQPLVRGADEAWRLQAALDHVAGHPQRFRLRRSASSESALLDLFAPLSSWAQRRLDVVSTPLLRSRGALFSYRLPESEAAEETEFLRDLLWMTDESQPERTQS
jgi:hypothetical protein